MPNSRLGRLRKLGLLNCPRNGDKLLSLGCDKFIHATEFCQLYMQKRVFPSEARVFGFHAPQSG